MVQVIRSRGGRGLGHDHVRCLGSGGICGGGGDGGVGDGSGGGGGNGGGGGGDGGGGGGDGVGGDHLIATESNIPHDHALILIVQIILMHACSCIRCNHSC